MFGIEASASHDCSRESLVLVVGSGDKTSLRALQRVLAGAELLNSKRPSSEVITD